MAFYIISYVNKNGRLQVIYVESYTWKYYSLHNLKELNIL